MPVGIPQPENQKGGHRWPPFESLFRFLIYLVGAAGFGAAGVAGFGVVGVAGFGAGRLAEGAAGGGAAIPEEVLYAFTTASVTSVFGSAHITALC